MFSALMISMVMSAAPAQAATPLDGVGRERLRLIKDLEREEAFRATVYRWGWTAGFAAVTAAQIIAIPFLPTEADRIDYIVESISSGIGVAFTAFLPLAVIGHSPKVQELPETVEGLAEAERVLVEDADDEAFAMGWLMHAGNALYSIATGLVLGLGWRHWESAAINAAVGIVVGEVMILTTPHNLRALTRPPPVSVAPVFSRGTVSGLALGTSW